MREGEKKKTAAPECRKLSNCGIFEDKQDNEVVLCCWRTTEAEWRRCACATATRVMCRAHIVFNEQPDVALRARSFPAKQMLKAPFEHCTLSPALNQFAWTRNFQYSHDYLLHDAVDCWFSLSSDAYAATARALTFAPLSDCKYPAEQQSTQAARESTGRCSRSFASLNFRLSSAGCCTNAWRSAI